MKYPIDYNVRTASKGSNDFDMQKNHVTSLDFGVMKPIEMKLGFPGDKFRVDVSQVTSVLTMPAPTYGKADMILRAFYVPLNDVWSNFGSFLSNQKVAYFENGLGSVSVPFLYVSDIVSIFTSQSALATPTTFNDPYDFYLDIVRFNIGGSLDDYTINQVPYKFTYKGRKLYDFFVSLGLKFPFCSAFNLGEAVTTHQYLGYGENAVVLANSLSVVSDDQYIRVASYAKQKISVLPLLCFWKFYLDWVVPSRFLSNYSDIRYIFESMNLENLEYSDFVHLFSRIPVSFLQDDFFTTAFSSPYGYEDSANVSSVVRLNNAQNDSLQGEKYPASIAPNNGDSPYIHQDDTDTAFINQFSLRSLGALQDMVNRGKIAGSKVKDYLEVTYGIRPNSDALHISQYLGSKRIPIDFGRIQTTTDTYNSDDNQGSLVGQYFGKAETNSNDRFHVEFDVKDRMHGFFFVTAEIQPYTSYTQGLAPEFTALNRLDFYDGSFDGIGVEAVPISLLCNMNNYSNDFLNDYEDQRPDKIFGFTPIYSRYKVNFDNISGDFVIPTLNTGLDSWYLSRMFKLDEIFASYPFINEKFLQAISDDTNESFDRIFSVANTSIDHFRVFFNIENKMSRNMKPLRDALEFTDGGKTISKSVNNGIQN